MPPYKRGENPGWSYEQLAAESGLTRSGLYMIEEGKRIPEGDTILKFSIALTKNKADADDLVAEFTRLASQDREDRG